jgi:1,4-dihydroxy-2-naphthoate octaprenyltransferase
VRALVAFVRLARPVFLGGGFIGFALGAAVARYDGYPLSATAYALGQAQVTAFQLMVHFANDYFDRSGDRLAQRTLFSGGSVLTSGELAPRVALTAAFVCAIAGAVPVVYAALAGDVAAVVAGVLMGALAWSYSAPPWRLSEHGLGELTTVAVVALLVPLAGYVAFAHHGAPHAWLATIPGACAMFAMMLCVEIPDAAADTASGKRNLVVRWGTTGAHAVAGGAAFTACAALFAIAVTGFGRGALPALVAAAVPASLAAALVMHRPFGSSPVILPLLGVGLYAVTALAMLILIA